MYNAIYAALSELKRIRAQSPDEIRRQAIVVLSDGEDTSSVIDFEQVLDAAKRSEVIVYAIGLKDREASGTGRWNEADYVLRSRSHGRPAARRSSSWTSTSCANIYGQIAEELANQYTIGYSSKNGKRDGAWRRIAVQVARGSVTARTKAGYFAPTVRK